MINECEYQLIEPKGAPATNHSVHDWALRLCVLSSVVLSFGTTNSETTHNIKSDFSCVHTSSMHDLLGQKALFTELNKNAEIKEHLISRLNSLTELTEDWDGNGAHPILPSIAGIVRDVIENTPASVLSFWRIFPDLNGTLLLSAKGKHIIGLSIGEHEFSYVARHNSKKIKGILPTTSKNIIKILTELKALAV